MSSEKQAPDEPIEDLLDLDEPEEAPSCGPTRSMPVPMSRVRLTPMASTTEPTTIRTSVRPMDQ